MPSGLNNALAMFQAILNFAFKIFLWNYVLVFSDNILMYSRNWHDHLTDTLENSIICLFHSIENQFYGIDAYGCDNDSSCITAYTTMVLSINQTHGLDIEFPTTTKKELTLFRVLELFFHYPAMAEDVFFLLFIASVFFCYIKVYLRVQD